MTVRSTDREWNCPDGEEMHRFGTGDFCQRCGRAWVDLAAALRFRGDLVVRDDDGTIRGTYGAPRPTRWGVQSFAPSVLDDPEHLSAMVESAKLTAAQFEVDGERFDWVVLTGCSRMRREDINAEWAGDQDGVAVGRVYAFAVPA